MSNLFQRSFTVETVDCSIEEFVRAINLPELKKPKFKNMEYFFKHYEEVPVNVQGKKLVMNKFTVEKMSTGLFMVTVAYRTPLRPIFSLFVILGLMCGVILGILILLLGVESEESKAGKIIPALHRFETLCKLAGVKLQQDQKVGE